MAYVCICMHMYVYVFVCQGSQKGSRRFTPISYYFNIFHRVSYIFSHVHTISYYFNLYHHFNLFQLFHTISYYFILFPTPHYRGLPWHRVLHLPEILVVFPRQELPRQSSARTATLQLQHNGETIKKSGD